MSTDERIAELKGKHEMLSERHNALVESIELMILEGRERNKNLDRHFAQFFSGMDKLAHIAELHQHRLDSLDDRLDKLEGNA